MYIISTFEHSVYIETVIAILQKKGISKENILAVPLDKRHENEKLFDTINSSDGVSLFDGAAALGTATMVLGVIYGYVLAWGPIIWGLIGLFAGAVAGFLLDLFRKGFKKRNKRNNSKSGDVVIMINCDKSQADMIEDLLWKKTALGVARLDLSGK